MSAKKKLKKSPLKNFNPPGIWPSKSVHIPGISSRCQERLELERILDTRS